MILKKDKKRETECSVLDFCLLITEIISEGALRVLHLLPVCLDFGKQFDEYQSFRWCEWNEHVLCKGLEVFGKGVKKLHSLLGGSDKKAPSISTIQGASSIPMLFQAMKDTCQFTRVYSCHPLSDFLHHQGSAPSK